MRPYAKLSQMGMGRTASSVSSEASPSRTASGMSSCDVHEASGDPP